MRIVEIKNFFILKDIWNTLLSKNLFGNNIFSSWEWLSTWWQYFGKNRKLLILAVEDQHDIVGIAPFMISKYRLPFLGTFKKVEFIGTPHSDYSNFILLKNDIECINLIFKYLISSDEWDWIELKELPEAALYQRILIKSFKNIPSKLDQKIRVCNICPYIKLSNTIDEVKKNLSKKMRKNLKDYLRKIEKNFNSIKFQSYNELSYSIDSAMDIFIKLHEMRWYPQGGVFQRTPILKNFHRSVARLFSKQGWLGLYFMLVDEKPVAASYGFVYSKKFYYYLSGFDPTYSPYSIGNLMIFYLLQNCVNDGLEEFDFMRGNETYKFFWAHHYRKNFEVRLLQKNIILRVVHWLTWSKTISNLNHKIRISSKFPNIK